MPEFTYEALDKSGGKSSGTVTARDTQDAAVRVRALGIYPTKIADGKNTAAAREVATTKVALTGKKVGRLEILLFTREMADLLDAGLPMDRAFSVLIDQTDSAPLKAMLGAMQGDIRAGQALSDALLKFPREFPRLYANMVRAGEVSGQLAPVMTRLAEFMEKEQTRRSQIAAALTYPCVLIGIAVSAVTFLLTFVIPKLSGIFKDLGSDLPITTRILLSMSDILSHQWWLVLMVIAAIVFGFRAWLRTESGLKTFDTIRLNMPIIGPLTRRIVSARLVRTLGTLLGGGVPILEALDISSRSVGNTAATDAIQLAKDGVRTGETLHESMARTDVFLPVVRHMTAVGEETGRLPLMLIRTADTLDFEVDNTMRRMTSLVEPLVVVVMGGFVGFVVLSILLPIFQANSLVK